MKVRTPVLSGFAGLAIGLLLFSSVAPAAPLYWSGNGSTQGGAGTWDTTLTRWGSVPAGPFSTVWNNGNLDTAIFGGTAGTATLGATIDVGGLQFNTTGYGITTTGFSLDFDAASNAILFNNIAAATITGPVGGTGNVTLTAANTNTSGTLTLNGTSTGGWSGTTTVNSGMTIALAGDNQGLNSTSGITLNGGGITLTNTSATAITNARVSNTAAITSNGGTFTYTNTSGTGVYAETIGSVALASGQLNFNLATNQAGTGSQTLTLSGLTQSGSGSVTFSAGTTAPNATKNRIQVSGASATSAGQIIGPWATTGTAANSQNDYAVYDASGYILPANITASAETTWTTAANAYTLSTPAKTATALTATRNITALKASSTATVTSSATTAGSPTFTIASGHSFNVGDPVMLSSLSGDIGANVAGQQFTVGTVYYVASVTGTTFTLAGTPGGTAINAGQARTVQFTGGLKLDSGNNLGTTGILNSGNAPLAIGRTAAGGELTLPTAGAGNLYVTTGLTPDATANSGLNGRIAIDAPIVDNGGALTLVKNGASVLRLQGTNTYTGGTVINAGVVTFTNNNNFGSAATPVTFNGSGALSFGPNYSFSFAQGGTVALSRPVTVNNGAIAGFYYNTPNTTMNISGAITGDGGIISGKDPVLTYGGGDGTISINFTGTGNTFTGPVTINNVATTFNSLADGSGPMILNAGFTYGAGAIANLSIPNRLVDVRGNVTITNSAGSTRTVTFGNISTTTGGAKTLTLSNTSTNGNGFATGNITNGAGTVGITKSGTGTWALSGTNTYSGATSTTTGQGGVLIFQGLQALSPNTAVTQNQISTGGTQMRLLNDSSASTAVTFTLNTVNGSGIGNSGNTIFVGNNSTANGGTNPGSTATNETISIGKLTMINNATSGGSNWAGWGSIQGANGYRLLINGVDLPTLVGITPDVSAYFVPTTANVTLAGTIRQPTSNAARQLTLQLDGTSSGNLVTGNIENSGDTSKALNVIKSNSSTWTLSGTNTYSGTTVVSAGTLIGTSAVQSFGTNLSGINIQGSGTLSLRNDSTVSFTNGTSPYNIANSASGATINVDRVSGTGSNTITVGNLTTTSTAGSWGLNFTGSNGVSLSAGTLNTPVSTVAATHTITNNIAGGGSLTLASVNNQATTVASPDLVFTGSGNTTVTGAITQTLATMDLIKNGAGILTLGGANTYTGATNVNQGTLLINGDSSAATGAITVASGATLGGIGSIGGNLALNGNADFWVEDLLDPLAVGGTLSFSTPGFGIASLLNIDWDAPGLVGTYTLVSGTVNFTNVSNVGEANEASVGTLGRTAYFQNGSLELVVVPEPTTMALLGAGVTLLGLHVARRRRA